jgi:hypothetical protein
MNVLSVAKDVMLFSKLESNGQETQRHKLHQIKEKK